jgi:putative pyruvate formate lyase activating enzyme
MNQPAYLETYEKGLLAAKITAAWDRMKACTICPRQCGVDRTRAETGFCNTGDQLHLASYGPHFGEERPLVGRNGSGTIFVTNCNLGCIFCQNYTISHLGEGEPVSDDQLSTIMVALQKSGCHNINFVSPSHVVPHILKALPMAVEMGLRVPLVYNTGGYDTQETLELLDGVVDIYMPDFKYTNGSIAKRYSQAEDYPDVVKAALKEMYRQTGDLVLDEQGIALRGLLIRHLVLPEDLAGTSEAMAFIAAELSTDTYVNIMDQYHPCGREIPQGSPLLRRITDEEYRRAVVSAKAQGLTRIDRELYPRW